jgi:hypothetical protein
MFRAIPLRGRRAVSVGEDSSVDAKSTALSALEDTCGTADQGGAAGDTMGDDRAGAGHCVIPDGDALRGDGSGTDESGSEAPPSGARAECHS